MKTNKIVKKHDELSKKFLTNIDSAKVFLELHMDPKVIIKCDIETLIIEPSSYVDSDLKTRYSDIVYKAHENHLSKDLFDSTISYLAKAREYSELQPLFDEIIENISDYKEDIMTYAEELMQRGEQMAQISMVQEMIRSGLELALIEKISHLNKKEIEKIKETMH